MGISKNKEVIKMKKCVEKAFACALIVISIVGSFVQTELIDSIIYVIIIPSFILSLVSGQDAA